MAELLKNAYAVILAGGGGTRFWPLSSAECPKQFLTFGKKDPLITQTIKCFSPLIRKDKAIIVSLENQSKLIKKFLPRFPKKNIILEPIGRNTAASIGLAAFALIKRNPEAMMIIAPCDHPIIPLHEFHKKIKEAIKIILENDVLVTFGVKPTFPATGYGYIQKGEKSEGNSFQIKRFREKPNLLLAKKFLKSGDFLWNSGVFAWKASVFLDALKKYLPLTYKKLEELFDHPNRKQYKQKIFRNLESISVDYAVLEKAKNTIVLPSRFKWNDIGDLTRINSQYKKLISLKSKNNIIYTPSHLIATIGVDNLIIVEKDGKLLVAAKNYAQDVKKVTQL